MSRKQTPTWSVVLPVYNCSAYLPQALRSIIDQAPSNNEMEIIVVDDRSTDADVQNIVSLVGRGRVLYRINEANSGSSTANFNKCLEAATGRLIHILHGDDWVSSGFYLKAHECLSVQNDVGMFFCRSFLHDETGELVGVTEAPKGINQSRRISDPLFLWYGNCIRTPSVVVRRQTYEQVGIFNEALRHVADWEMWERIVGECGAVYHNWPLANYRLSDSNETNLFYRSGQWAKEWYKLREILKERRQAFKAEDFDNLLREHAHHLIDKYTGSNDRDALRATQLVYQNLGSIKQRFISRWINHLATQR